jgi:hypothetical protein
MTMNTRGAVRIDPGSLADQSQSAEIELAVPFTEPSMTDAVLKRAAALTAGLNARVALVAVHAVPYSRDFSCPSATHAFLVEQLVELAGRCELPVSAEVVLARSREEGFRHALKPSSTVLVGTRKRPWRTAEEKLARALARDGHQVVLMHVE